MRRAAALYLGLSWIAVVNGQMVLPAGTSLTVDAGTSLRIEVPLVWTLESGSSAENNGTITLGPGTDLDEADGAAITGVGTERTTRAFTLPLSAENPGGLGGILTTDAILGNTLIERGHLPFTDYSGHTSLARWIDLSPANNNGLNATLGFRYDEAELNGLVEAEQRVHIRAEQDIWWSLVSSVNTGLRTVTTSALDSLGLFTTFDTDLPNAISGSDRSTFALLGAPGEQLYLRVPAGARAETLELFTANGARISTLSPHWGEGQHPVPELSVASGVYCLRVNGHTSFAFLQP